MRLLELVGTWAHLSDASWQQIEQLCGQMQTAVPLTSIRLTNQDKVPMFAFRARSGGATRLAGDAPITAREPAIAPSMISITLDNESAQTGLELPSTKK